LIAESQGDIGAVVYCRNIMAMIYLDQGKIELAESEASKSLAKAVEYGLKNDERKGLLTLSTIYENKGDMAKALQSKKKYIKLDQEIFSEENIRRVERLKAQYENEKKDAENLYLKNQAQLNKKVIETQRSIILLTIITIVLLFIVALAYYYFYRTKARLSRKIELQNQEILADKELIEGQSAKLEEVNRAKSRFFTNISHDLRSPLSLILGSVDSIKSDTDIVINPTTIQGLDTIERNSKRLLFLTDEINDLTKLEEGKINLKAEVVLLADYLSVLVNMFKSSAQFKGIRLQFMDKCSYPVKAKIDLRQFEKIIYNLISNAIKHSDDGDSILINVAQTADKILIEVTDTGEGIPKNSLPHVFDRFYQAPDKNYRTEEGLGIGLALVKELVELHQGDIKVESNEGEGTTFIIEIPLGDQNQSLESTLMHSDYFTLRNELFTETERQAALSRKKLSLYENNENAEKVLIVEDHPEIRNYLRGLLESRYFILEAGNGREALSTLKSTGVDLIITDLMMPVMDGFELLESLFDDSNFSTIPVLVVSGKSNESDKERILKTGVNNFLQKPFNKNELLLRVQNLITDKKERKKKESGINAISKKVTQIDSMEVALLTKINNLLLAKIKSENFTVLDLAEELASSERQVYRLVKKLTEMTPNEYIKEYKLQYAHELITKNKVKNASEASREVGIKNVTIFSKDFESKYGKKPADLFISDKK
jgi:signal transduction histidine kinase/DNA-binding response OmpR family regulator